MDKQKVNPQLNIVVKFKNKNSNMKISVFLYQTSPKIIIKVPSLPAKRSGEGI